MPKLPRITGTELLRALRAAGWEEARQRGSHVILRHAEQPGGRIVVPVHRGRTLKAGTLNAILREAGLTVDELVGLL